MYIAIFIIVGLLIFPIIISLYFFIDNTSGKVFFAIYVFGKIKIVSGYVRLRNSDSIYLHLSDTKAIIVDFSLLRNVSDGSSFIKIFNISSIEIYLDVFSLSAKAFYYLTLIFNFVNGVHLGVYNNYGLNLKFNLAFINQDSKFFSIKIKSLVQFNLICIVFKLIANIINVGVNNVKRKRIRLKKRSFKFG